MPRRAVVIVWIICVFFAITGCDTGKPVRNPEQVVTLAIQDWAGRNFIGYRNLAIETLDEDHDTAVMQITAEFQYDPAVPWIEEQATIRLMKLDGAWTPPEFFPFAPTDRALKRIQSDRAGSTPVPGETPNPQP